jgi:processive 1,2-diacylglycerol beta-glucosyltransferase
LTVTIGRDPRLQVQMENLRQRLGRDFEILGWTDQLPRKMLESHFLISKAGGATTQEAIAAKCPMLINQVVPGQEEGNARLIAETRSGAIATTPDAIISALETAMADEARLWHDWSANISRLSRPNAAMEIAKLLLEL